MASLTGMPRDMAIGALTGDRTTTKGITWFIDKVEENILRMRLRVGHEIAMQKDSTAKLKNSNTSQAIDDCVELMNQKELFAEEISESLISLGILTRKLGEETSVLSAEASTPMMNTLSAATLESGRQAMNKVMQLVGIESPAVVEARKASQALTEIATKIDQVKTRENFDLLKQQFMTAKRNFVTKYSKSGDPTIKSFIANANILATVIEGNRFNETSGQQKRRSLFSFGGDTKRRRRRRKTRRR